MSIRIAAAAQRQSRIVRGAINWRGLTSCQTQTHPDKENKTPARAFSRSTSRRCLPGLAVFIDLKFGFSPDLGHFCNCQRNPRQIQHVSVNQITRLPDCGEFRLEVKQPLIAEEKIQTLE